MKWYENYNGEHNGIIISSRVRLARNLENYCFPNRLNNNEAIQLIEDVKKALFSANSSINNFLEEIDMNTISQVEKIAMMERHLVSPLFLNVKIPNALVLSKDESISIMINEEDHIRIQSLKAGKNLNKALEEAYKIDDLIEENVKIAYDRKLGFLTACPTNVGTGLRASYMIHVPALETTGKLRFLLEAIGKFGITVRGIYGEGSEAQGSVYQISNQVTLGIKEEEVIDNLTSVTNQIIEQELIVRNRFLSEKRLEFEDAVYRSYGILKHARVLTSKEAMTLLSDFKLGIELGILKTKEDKSINIFNLMTCIQPANLQKYNNKNLTTEERDIERASYIRNNLPDLI